MPATLNPTANAARYVLTLPDSELAAQVRAVLESCAGLSLRGYTSADPGGLTEPAARHAIRLTLTWLAQSNVTSDVRALDADAGIRSYLAMCSAQCAPWRLTHA